MDPASNPLIATFSATAEPNDVACIIIDIVDDTDVEDMFETFTVTATSGFFPGGNADIIRIQDNDGKAGPSNIAGFRIISSVIHPDHGLHTL